MENQVFTELHSWVNSRNFFIQAIHHFLLLIFTFQVNFSYFEAGENNQALVKLVTCERLVVYIY